MGSLVVGKAAVLFMVNAETLELTGTVHDPKYLIARAGVTGNVALTMINGKVGFKDNMLLGIDEHALRMEGEAVCTRVLRNPCGAFHNLI